MKEPLPVCHGLLEVPEAILGKWQNVVDIMAELLVVPAGLIMRCHGREIEVLVASRSPGNPYHPGEKEHLPGSGLYCETVINTRRLLLVPDALKDEKWRNNPDIKLGMVSYLGFPILLPDGQVFGTICVLDLKENAYSNNYQEMLRQFRELIETHLQLLHTASLLQDALDQVKTLQGFLPICAHCKKIRDDQGYWRQIESYLKQHSELEFSHSICPECFKKNYGGI
jgi:GAF domain-containing protein